MNEMKTVLAQVLRKCRLFLDEETPVPEMQPRLIMQSANGIHIKLEYLRWFLKFHEDKCFRFFVDSFSKIYFFREKVFESNQIWSNF